MVTLTEPAHMSRHFADLYDEDDGVLPACLCGWEGTKVPTYDGAAEAYAQHRLEAAHISTSSESS